jgi:pSer/pThr/pTyr-binding forkhead associated (FHA) protein
MPESVLAVLKLVFLAVLYLFLARVIRAVWVEIYAERRSAAENVHAGTAEAPKVRTRDVPVPVIATEKVSKRELRKAEKTKANYVLKVVEPPEQKGTTYAVADEMTIGRAAACAVPIRDDFASQLHARVFRRDGDVFCEDLGSTNGTFLNKKPVHGPNRLTKGDRIQVGNTVLEFTK